MKLRQLASRLPKGGTPETQALVAALAAIFRRANDPISLAGVWTPTVTAGSGTITTSSAAGIYHVVGDLKFFNVLITVTTNGTGGSSVIFTLPTISEGVYVFSGRETTVGKQLQGIVASAGGNTVSVVNYDNTYPAADGYILRVSGFYA